MLLQLLARASNRKKNRNAPLLRCCCGCRCVLTFSPVLPAVSVPTCLLLQLLAQASNRRKNRNALAAAVAAAAAADSDGDQKEAELVDLLGGGGGSSRSGKGRTVGARIWYASWSSVLLRHGLNPITEAPHA